MTTVLLASILPHLASGAMAILVPLIVALIVKQFQKIGIDIEAKNREALQSALENAAAVAISHTKGSPVTPTPTASVTNVAVDYVKTSVPGAIKKFSLNEEKIKKLLEPHLAKAVNKVSK